MGDLISFRKECFSFEANVGTKRRGWPCVEVGEDERTIGCQLGGGHRERSVMMPWAHMCVCGWMHAFSHAGSYLQDRLPPPPPPPPCTGQYSSPLAVTYRTNCPPCTVQYSSPVAVTYRTNCPPCTVQYSSPVAFTYSTNCPPCTAQYSSPLAVTCRTNCPPCTVQYSSPVAVTYRTNCAPFAAQYSSPQAVTCRTNTPNVLCSTVHL